MNRYAKHLKRLSLPASVFIAVMLSHYFLLGLITLNFPSPECGENVPQGLGISWLGQYFKNQDYCLGFSYALSLAFAAYALRRYREERFCRARNLAIGSVTFSGFLAVLGCFLAGCCGSPMWVVYLNLFGATFFPLGKPWIALLTTVFILAAWYWMNRPAPSKTKSQKADCCRNESTK